MFCINVYFSAASATDFLRRFPDPDTGVTKRICLVCSSVFNDASNARRHVKRMHLGEAEDCGSERRKTNKLKSENPFI
jgi:hypothetical protein